MEFFKEPLVWMAALGAGYYWYTTSYAGGSGGNISNVVMIHSKTCPACEYMMSSVITRNNMSRGNFAPDGAGGWVRNGDQTFKTLEIESDEGEKIFDAVSKKYGYDGIPIFVGMDRNGNIVGADMGIKEWPEFLSMWNGMESQK